MVLMDWWFLTWGEVQNLATVLGQQLTEPDGLSLFVCVVWQILEETYKMEFMYSGVESRQVVIIHHMRLQAKALQLIVTARTTRG